jgi:hypothetical protein
VASGNFVTYCVNMATPPVAADNILVTQRRQMSFAENSLYTGKLKQAAVIRSQQLSDNAVGMLETETVQSWQASDPGVSGWLTSGQMTFSLS